MMQNGSLHLLSEHKEALADKLAAAAVQQMQRVDNVAYDTVEKAVKNFEKCQIQVWFTKSTGFVWLEGEQRNCRSTTAFS